jgi:hypothetical protein
MGLKSELASGFIERSCIKVARPAAHGRVIIQEWPEKLVWQLNVVVLDDNRVTGYPGDTIYQVFRPFTRILRE